MREICTTNCTIDFTIEYWHYLSNYMKYVLVSFTSKCMNAQEMQVLDTGTLVAISELMNKTLMEQS
jgi:hypothetical protein